MTKIDQRDSASSIPAIAGALQQALRSWDGFFEWLPVGVYVCDAEGSMMLHNRRAVELMGRAPLPGEAESAFWLSMRSSVVQGPLASNVRPLTEGPLRHVLASGRAMRDREFMIERGDGTRVTLLSNLEPLFDDRGRLIGGVCALQDITRRKRLETIRRERERQFRDLLEALPVALYTTDPEGRLTFYNQAAADLWGYEPNIDGARWCGSWRLFHADSRDMPHAESPMAVAIQQQRPQREAEAELERADGTRIPFISYPTLLRDKSGRMIGAVNMMIDISERKRTEVEQKALMDELNHRVKNTLATVQSVAAQTFRKAQVPSEIRDLFEKRIFAMSKAHNQLSASRWTSADLNSLAGEILEPYHGDDEELADRIVIAARLVEKKGYRYLLQSLAALRKQGRSVVLDILGEGPLQGELETQVRDLGLEGLVTFAGTAPHATFLQRLIAGDWDAMALPSIVARDGDKEGIPVSLIEAMACGLPVVATDNGGIPELLDGGAGLIVPEYDVEALTAAMARLMDDVALHAAMIAKARQRIESEYDLQAIVDRLEQGFTRGHL